MTTIVHINPQATAPTVTPTGGPPVVITPVPPGPAGPAGPPGAGWPMFVGPNQPTAADYGTTTIPMHAVWIKSPT